MCKTFMQKTNSTERNYTSKEVNNRGMVIPCLQTGRLNIVKISILPKLIYRFKVMPIKISTGFCLLVLELIEHILKWKFERPRIAKILL